MTASTREPLDPASVLESAREVLARDAQAVLAARDRMDGSFASAVDLLLACTGKVLVTGMGTSGATAQRLSHLLSVGGTPSLFIHAADGLHGGLGAVTAEDAIIAISKGGESDELNEFCARTKRLGAKLIAMTAVPQSRLGSLSDVALLVDTPQDTDPGYMIAMGSALAACAMGDALVVVLMELRGYSWEAFEFTHPGGAVGKAIEQKHGVRGA